MGIVWLASYPKSGNTWLRFLLYSAMFGPPEQSLDIARKLPDVHRPLPTDVMNDQRIIAKTHFAFSDKHPKAAETERAVLIVRHPRDVLFSALNYRRLSGLTTAQMTDAQYARHFIGNLGDPEFKAQGFGTWQQHVSSWADQDRFPVHVLKYEQLKADTAHHLRAVLDFLEISAEDSAIDDAVKASSFDSMRAMEIREKHQNAKNPKSQSLFVGTAQSRQSGTYFMNAGKSGNSLRTISPDLESAFNKAFEQPMQQYGYE
ncbi:MAG: sulfotransferase domain-containing protein [Phycisphaerales bacterium]|nr:sulfotransferase domain-containing protein [Phycisphaerales bacterium]